MDIQMSGIDGLEATAQIQKQFPNIIIILATAYERFDVAKRAIPLGVFSYLVKPITKKLLLAELDKVKEHLNQLKEQSNRQIKDAQFLNKTKSIHLFCRFINYNNI